LARYRKIAVRMHGDEKYRALTQVPPCGAGLWWHLLAGPQTGPIPGVFSIGRAAFAELLRWPQGGFDEAYAEVFQQGMVEADWEARVVWVPKAIEHNLPESPNVIVSWISEWDLIPECELKLKAWDSIKKAIYSMGKKNPKAYRDAFDKSIRKPILKSAKALPKDIGESGTGTGTGTGSKENPPTPFQGEKAPNGAGSVSHSAGVTEVFTHWKLKLGHPRAVLDPKREKAIARGIKHYSTAGQDGVAILKQAVDGCAVSPFHLGENDRKTRFDDIELICRDAKHVESFLRIEEDHRLNGGAAAPSPQARAAAAWLEQNTDAG